MAALNSIEFKVPTFRFRVENPIAVVRALLVYEVAAVKKRILLGRDARGRALPMPKSGGAPYRRTGQLYDSIQGEVVTTYGEPIGVIQPTGLRADAKARDTGRRRRQARARAALAEQLRGELGDSAEAKAEIKRRTRGVKLGRVATRNMDVASILTYPPKDKRSRNGQRGRYDVFRASAEEQAEMVKIAARVARFALTEVETGVRHRGRGRAA